MQRGRVKQFYKEKGFGFIHRPIGEDVFVHCSDIVTKGSRELRPGQLVEFSFERGDRGGRARNVRILNEQVSAGEFRSMSRVALEEQSQSYLSRPLGVVRSSAENKLNRWSKWKHQYVPERTALIIAVNERDIDRAQALLRQDINPNVQVENGETALMWAVHNKHKEMVEMLLEHGANSCVESPDGITALSVAGEKKYVQIQNLLKRAASQHKKVAWNFAAQTGATDASNSSSGLGVLEVGEYERWESSDGFGHTRREGGQFGSFPKHEDYSDEAAADHPQDNEWYDRYGGTDE